MKKKKISTKLNFKKSVISDLAKTQILGGGSNTIVVDGPFDNTGAPGSHYETVGISCNGGSECACL